MVKGHHSTADCRSRSWYQACLIRPVWKRALSLRLHGKEPQNAAATFISIGDMVGLCRKGVISSFHSKMPLICSFISIPTMVLGNAVTTFCRVAGCCVDIVDAKRYRFRQRATRRIYEHFLLWAVSGKDQQMGPQRVDAMEKNNLLLGQRFNHTSAAVGCVDKV